MRRITSACLQQTMRFDTSGDISPEKEYELYRAKLDKKGTAYVIDHEEKQPDGSVVIKIRKQYNTYKTDGYMD
ncbi:MAG: protein pyrBI [Fusicatenibacter sp.]|nr:protein pyrBI [Fusicatenibacter sp.]